MIWTQEQVDKLKSLHARGLRKRALEREMGMTQGQIAGATRRYHLHFEARGGGQLGPNHPAIVEGRTLFPTRVQPAEHAVSVLKPGLDSYKLGNRVTKGPWRGMPIFSLTLEERATCPRSCAQWRSCYGNTSHGRIRLEHGPILETRLGDELRELQWRYPGGFVVRLHMLGDFYSVDYVRLWRWWLKRFPALHVFGYTAWHRPTPIGRALHRLIKRERPRFAIRLSGTVIGMRRTIVVDRAKDATTRGAIICPAQTGRTESCGTCALCWAPAADNKTIAFLRHGMHNGGGGRPRKNIAKTM